MSEFAIEVRNLSRSYGKSRVVDGLELHVPEGKVYGFLGRNGAGKTTTIRMIMGMVKPETGEIFLHGRNVAQNRRWASRQIGAIIETPGFYDNLNARENLLMTTRLFDTPSSKVEEVLEIAGLREVGPKKVREYSLGMKQRLGIANALVHSPGILILDEPTNGLDPVGIKEMRIFLRTLSQLQGITTVISSHILSEIQQTVDYVGIIDQGKLLHEGDIASFAVLHQTSLILEVDCAASAVPVLKEMGLRYQIEGENVVVGCSRGVNDELNRRLIAAGVKVFALIPNSPSLEDQFIQTLRLA